MVITPSVGQERRPTARNRARTDRVLEAGKRRSSTLGRAMRYRAARKFFRRGALSRAAQAGRVARTGGAFLRGAGTVARAGATAARAGLIGIAIAAVVVGGLVALRMATGKPLEGVSEDLNQMFLGDKDEEARARMASRRWILGNYDVTRSIGQEKAISAGIRKAAEDIYRQEKAYQDGYTELKKAYPVESTLDLIIGKLAAVLKDMWSEPRGKAAFKAIRSKLRRIQTGHEDDSSGGAR